MPNELQILTKGLPNLKHTNRLLNQILSADSVTRTVDDRVKSLLVEAQKRETGAVFRGVYEVTTDSPISHLKVEESLKPYYGHIEPALEELYQLGMARPYGEYWLNYFLKDNPVYRVNAVCCMCAAAAVLATGKTTRLTGGQNQRTAPRPEVIKEAQEFQVAAAANSDPGLATTLTIGITP